MSEEQDTTREAYYEDACVRSLRNTTPVRRVGAEGATEEQGRVAATKLTQVFGLDPRAAALVTLVDLMIFGVDIFSLWAFVVMGMVVAAVLGYIVYMIQRKWFGDDHDTSFIKGLIVGLLTAIPVPLTPLLAVPCGIVGVVQLVRRRHAAR